jgi:hypothetical protein
MRMSEALPKKAVSSTLAQAIRSRRGLRSRESPDGDAVRKLAKACASRTVASKASAAPSERNDEYARRRTHARTGC